MCRKKAPIIVLIADSENLKNYTEFHKTILHGRGSSLVFIVLSGALFIKNDPIPIFVSSICRRNLVIWMVVLVPREFHP